MPQKPQKTLSKLDGSRAVRTFPAASFEEALQIADAMQKMAAGPKVRRLTLFEYLKKSPDSGTSRQLITNSSRYGLTKGSYKADYIELTPDGAKASNPDAPASERLRARFTLAIDRIAPFKQLYEQFKGNKLPSQSVLRDAVLETEIVPAEQVDECVETFIVNLKFLTLLRTVAGAERILPLDHVLEELGSRQTLVTPISAEALAESAQAGKATGGEEEDFSKICFYIAPIGDEGSQERKHSDLFLGSLVEPALEGFGLAVIRADKIGKPGMITSQVIEHIVKSRLVVADLSFHNPNVFYELCLRHVCRLPTVQIIRASDLIPFDLGQFSTIKIDTADIYSLVPKLESYRAEIALQTRRALEGTESVDNPISAFYPALKATF